MLRVYSLLRQIPSPVELCQSFKKKMKGKNKVMVVFITANMDLQVREFLAVKSSTGKFVAAC